MAHRAHAVLIAAALLLSGVHGCAAPEAGTEPAVMNDDREIVRQAFQRWKAGQGGPFELLAADARWTIVGSSPKSRTYRSKQEFLDEVITPFNARLSKPLVPSVRRLYSDGDSVIVHFDAEATAKDGVAYRNTYAWFLEMQGGRIVNATAFFDTRLFDEFWNRVAPTP